jgi:uncharacterized damage-inducible protein DinB
MIHLRLETIRKLFAYNDCARDRLMAVAVQLTDSQLDQPFEMGPGSLRETLRHRYGAERIWLERLHGRTLDEFPRSRSVARMDELWEAFGRLAATRNSWIEPMNDADLQRPITYTNMRGDARTSTIADVLFQVCNHGTHHRTQVLNMLRHVGATVPELDCMAMTWEAAVEETALQKGDL